MSDYLSEMAAHAGANFISPEIATLVRRFFGGMKLDLAAASLQSIAPDFAAEVTDVLFEHSPARRHPAFTNDRRAFDVLLKRTTIQRQNGFIAVELKYSETMQEPPATLRPRYDELSRLSGLYKDPDHPDL